MNALIAFMQRIRLYLIAAPAIILLIALVYRECSTPHASLNKATHNTTTSVVVHDTIRQLVGSEHIAYRYKAKLVHDTSYIVATGSANGTVYTNDTALRSMVAINDTTIGRVRVLDSFYFPQMIFATHIERQPDTVQTINSVYLVRDTITIGSNGLPLWQQILMNLGACGVGYIIGRATK